MTTYEPELRIARINRLIDVYSALKLFVESQRISEFNEEAKENLEADISSHNLSLTALGEEVRTIAEQVTRNGERLRSIAAQQRECVLPIVNTADQEIRSVDAAREKLNTKLDKLLNIPSTTLTGPKSLVPVAEGPAAGSSPSLFEAPSMILRPTTSMPRLQTTNNSQNGSPVLPPFLPLPAAVPGPLMPARSADLSQGSLCSLPPGSKPLQVGGGDSHFLPSLGSAQSQTLLMDDQPPADDCDLDQFAGGRFSMSGEARPDWQNSTPQGYMHMPQLEAPPPLETPPKLETPPAPFESYGEKWNPGPADPEQWVADSNEDGHFETTF